MHYSTNAACLGDSHLRGSDEVAFTRHPPRLHSPVILRGGGGSLSCTSGVQQMLFSDNAACLGDSHLRGSDEVTEAATKWHSSVILRGGGGSLSYAIDVQPMHYSTNAACLGDSHLRGSDEVTEAATKWHSSVILRGS
ncbi:hypothetical protein OPS25_00435, partial [Alteromonas ponticola]